MLREVEERLRCVVGYKTKIVEGVGKKLKDFYQTLILGQASHVVEDEILFMSPNAINVTLKKE